MGQGGSLGIPVLRARLVSPAVGLKTTSAPRTWASVTWAPQRMGMAPRLPEPKEHSSTALRAGLLGSCAWPGTGLDDPCRFLPIQEIPVILFWDSFNPESVTRIAGDDQ